MNRVEEAIQALRTKPLKSTTFERVQLLRDLQHVYDDMPQPLRFGHVVMDFLHRVSTPVASHDLLAGRHLDCTLNAEEEAFFQKFIKDPKNLYRSTLYDTTHCTLDWAYLVKYGLPGLRERALAGIVRARDAEHASFLQGAVCVYDALMDFARRYAVAARDAGLDAAAASLEALARQAPGTFREGLQLVWLVNLVNCSYLTLNPTLTQGRLDVILFPLYEADIATGRLTRERALELVKDFYCKHNLIMGRGEHQMGDHTNTTSFQRILNFDAPQYLPLAGTDTEGRSVVNDLTLLFAQAITPGLKNPIPVIRYCKGLDTEHPELWKVLMEKALQSCSMMFYNDGDVKAALAHAGVAEEDVGAYEHFGCNWCSPGPDSCWMLSRPRSFDFAPELTKDETQQVRVPYFRTNSPNGWPADFVAVMHELNERPIPPTSIDEFYEAFFERYRGFIARKLAFLNLELDIRQRHPAAILTLGDCLSQPAIERAESLAASAKYHFELQSFYGIATLIDCFTAVDQLVFREKRATLKELVVALDDNFQGHEQLMELCRHAEKFGADTSLANTHATRLARTSVEIANEMSAPSARRRRLFLMPSLEGDTWHIRMGAQCPATPNGRLAGEPFAQNSRPANGSCRKGLTAMFSSLLHLPFELYTSGALNLDVQPENFQGDAGRELFGKLLASYFNRGGLHAQVSCVSVDDLKDAQSHPENHRDLLVRVTGYSGVFVDMSTTIQNDIIERMNL